MQRYGFQSKINIHKHLPSEFRRLIGQRKKFHLRFGNRQNLLNLNDFLIYNASEDTMIQPTTPESIIKEIAVSSTTVSSSTTPAEKIGEKHKRIRDSTRRALFTEAENRLYCASQHFFSHSQISFNLT